MTSASRLEGVRAYGRAANAFDAVAWRPPTTTRFDPRAVNDPAVPEPSLKELVAALPGWVTVVAGGVVAAMMGAMLGGALSI